MTSPDDTYMVNIPNEDQLYLNKSSFTISLWMKAASNLLPTGTTSSAYLLCKGSFTKNVTTGATGKRFNVEFKSSELRFAIDDDVTKKELKTSGTLFFTDNWEHVVVMRDVLAHKLRLYLNGNFVTDLDETGVTGVAEVSDLILGNIGELELLGGTAPSPYKGQLDELKIFNYALNATEVLDLYQNVLLSNEKFSQNKNEIFVYPNPVSNQINIYIPSNKQSYLTATLTDVTGKVIIKDKMEFQGNGRFVLKIANKKLSGIYILNVYGENINNNFKIAAK
ncbi:LamG-like jellyroll fold domain-containing protein [Mariniflexile soesokkakense]|uniref:LamG-like jellyroll fold domain-containing protein n=1 Tax=Mariniflexile soesokkakense TaxID=1343160 RepID=A0ABV0A9V4_9FLAO